MQILQSITRMRPRSKERYYSPEKWNNDWSGGYHLNSPSEDARYGTLLAWMHRWEGEGPLLDIGCGDGLLEERFRQISSVPIVAFDYSVAAIDRAKARRLVNVEFQCADSRTFQTERQFSVIVFNESLYYVDNYLDLLRRLSVSLRPGGVFAVSMHDTGIAKRIWKELMRSYRLLNGVVLQDEKTNTRWNVRLLAPSGRSANHLDCAKLSSLK